jgi:hypothetical protein
MRRYTLKNRHGKISFHNWWVDTHNSMNALQRFFKMILGDSIDKYDKIRIYSIFGNMPVIEKDNRTLYIQYSGEPVIKNTRPFDINIVPDIEKDNIIPIPHIFMQMHINKINIDKLCVPRSLKSIPKKFCLFSVSSPKNKDRINFFKELSKYNHVDSCGKVLNNLGYNCPGGHASRKYHRFISNYKFMICFENTSMTNYITEKILNSYASGTIPIYWGCPNISDYINMDSILYLKPNYSQLDIDHLISEIILLDNNDELYKEKYERPFFKNGKIPDNFQVPIIKQKIKAILD